jgi:hypothetical protein
MSHQHLGDPMKLCRDCVPEIKEEMRRARFWRRALFAFALVMAAVCVYVLVRIGGGH